MEVVNQGLIPEILQTLCDPCEQIPITRLLESPRNGYTLFDNFQILTESAKSCALCNLIFRSIQDLDNGLSEINIVAPPQFLIIEVMKESKTNHRLLRLWTDPSPEATRMGVDIGLPIQPGAGSELHILLLKEWLRDCGRNHADHGFPLDEKDYPKLPTTVLDILTQDCPDRRMRLRDTVNVENTLLCPITRVWMGTENGYPLRSRTKQLSMTQ